VLTAFREKSNRLEQVLIKDFDDLSEDLLWIDALDPSDEERQWLLLAYQQVLPDLDDMEEVESSARYYTDEDGTHIYSYFLDDFSDYPRNVSVALVMHQERLFTLREVELATFRLYRLSARRPFVQDISPQAILVGLLETKIDHLADVVEDIYAKLDEVTRKVLGEEAQDRAKDMEHLITELARLENLNGNVRLSVMEQQRMVSIVQRRKFMDREAIGDLQEHLPDIESLIRHTAFLFEKINFLMEAAMGLVNIEQNKIIKIFTVASVIFLPPTLIASIWGMNFAKMPWLSHENGFYLAIAMMLAVALLPLWYFHRKKWL
jgi:magnesium transporter